MAAAVKHARIGADVTSPQPTIPGKYLQTSSTSTSTSTGTGGGGGGVAGRKNSISISSLKPSSSSSHQDDAKSTATSTTTASEGGGGGVGGGLGAFARRRSTFKGIANSMMSIRRMTKGSLDKEAAAAAAAAAAKPKIRMENTYRTSPREEQRFKAHEAHEAILQVLNTRLNGQTYNAVKAPTLTAMLSEQVKAAVKELHCDRHKLVASVVLGPVSDQGLVVASRGLWDSSCDSSSSATFNNGSIFAIASVYAVYYE